ncbi:EAL domain-containing protein [Alkalicoccus halolimnae]|uniref:EAL domain-containing protein n=1 Tax=Alkalicoccus halolimnae TaxID=1667239 RepID=A0AAJ8LUJ1_9BACI|nr:EAL domain-containing protein [Alkalicoccus halolimnae]
MNGRITADFVNESREKCWQAGMDPGEVRIPSERMSARELFTKRNDYNEILEVVSFFSDKVLHSLAGTPILIVISDENGYILDIVGDETIKDMVQKLGIEAGVRFTQEDLGTNVISLALQQRHPVTLIGDDHFFQFLHGTACYSAPFHYTDLDNLLGSISIMTALEEKNPLFLNMLSNVVDSIERELLLRKQNRKLNILNQIMLSRTQNAIIVTDAEGIVTEYNAFAEILSGFTSEEIVGRDIFKSDITGKYFHDVLHKQQIFKDVEMKFNNNNNDEMICLFDAQPIYDNQKDTVIGAFAQLRDITERFRLQESYNYLAYHDELTGLPNRRYFQNELEKFIGENKKTAALLLIDLDGFKNINDTFGHSNGDKLLQSVSERMKICCRENGLLARISGDEFMIFMPDVLSEADVRAMAETLLNQFKEPFMIDERCFFTTASIGAALYHETVPSLEDYMVHVDAAMYKAKSQGKNDYMIFSPEMYINESENLLLENDLRQAINRDELFLVYQGQVDARTGNIVGVEALIRWHHPEKGLLSPATFIPLAEKTGLIFPLGDWVIRTACEQHQEWLKAGLPPIKVSVNLSAQQFLKQDLVQTTANVIRQSGIDPQYLEFEITESMTMDYSYAENVIKELKNLGVGVSMDDFGTGYSSLYYLKRFKIDAIKIDKTFIDDLCRENDDATIVQTMIVMAENLGLRVIAEGVEDRGQLDYLMELGCYFIQGYYFMKPLSGNKFMEEYTNIVEEVLSKR